MGKDFIKHRWNKLSPKTKRYTVIGVVGAVVLLMLYMFVTSTPQDGDTSNPRDVVVSDILTGADTRQLGIEGLNNRTQMLEKTVHDMHQHIEDLSAQLEKARKSDARAKLADKIEDLQRLMANMRERAESLTGQDKTQATDAPIHVTPVPRQTPAPSDQSTPGSSQADASIWERPAPTTMMGGPGYKDTASQTDDTATGSGQAIGSIEIRTIGGASKPASANNKAKQKTIQYLPAGSIISGVLITGMEAPTSNGARNHPFPALIRVKKSAILPNHYRLDIRECFIIASGWGSLSAERAYLRAETLSCVRRDGGVIEVALNAYAVGEDGKVGLRGRVVSKQGQMLAKSLMAGFLSGMSQVFGQVPVPTIQTSPSGNVAYQDVLSGDSVASGAVQGASSALDRLARYYLDMAKNIFPVIEINAGRHVSFIVTDGARLKTVASGSD